MTDSEAASPNDRSGEGITRSVTICNQRGLHARAAAKFVRLASGFDAEIAVTRNDMTVSGHSIMGLMMLSAAPGCQVDLHARGPQAENALDSLSDLIQGKFDED